VSRGKKRRSSSARLSISSGNGRFQLHYLIKTPCAVFNEIIHRAGTGLVTRSVPLQRPPEFLAHLGQFVPAKNPRLWLASADCVHVLCRNIQPATSSGISTALLPLEAGYNRASGYDRRLVTKVAKERMPGSVREFQLASFHLAQLMLVITPRRYLIMQINEGRAKGCF